MAKLGTPISNSKKMSDGVMYRDRRSTKGANNSNCRGEYVVAMVVHATEMKIRFKLVDHEESMGIARKEPSGRAIGASREDSIAAMIGRVLLPQGDTE